MLASLPLSSCNRLSGLQLHVPGHPCRYYVIGTVHALANRIHHSQKANPLSFRTKFLTHPPHNHPDIFHSTLPIVKGV